MVSLNESRREFLRRSALAATALAAGAQPARATTPNDRLRIGLVGVGGMGSGHLAWFLGRPDCEVVALCDVDAGHLAAAAGAATAAQPKRYSDFRDVVARDDIDAVVVATPDHWHALVSIAAAQSGKHVYCEKPLTNSVAEGRALANAVKHGGVVLQTGSHERSNPGASVAKQMVAEGKLGEVKSVRIRLPNADDHLQQVENFSTPPADTPAPAGLDYDFWLGHTPVVPYNEKRCHFWWRFHSAYGGGEITDRGAHVIDLAHMILGLDATGPTRVEAVGQKPKGDFYDAFITFRFESHYPGGLVLRGDNSGKRGLTLEGTEGSLFVEVHGCALTATPASLLDGVTLPKVDPYDVHRRNFLDAIRGQGTPVAGVEAGHRTASACHLNNIAMRIGKPFDWDPVAERASLDEANALLAPTMRAPWSL
ncbi:MAG: Gfo/Idh/MocA family protein [Lacipirellulaceae bacterium]